MLTHRIVCQEEASSGGGVDKPNEIVVLGRKTPTHAEQEEIVAVLDTILDLVIGGGLVRGVASCLPVSESSKVCSKAG